MGQEKPGNKGPDPETFFLKRALQSEPAPSYFTDWLGQFGIVRLG
jgi:hypothetical protein